MTNTENTVECIDCGEAVPFAAIDSTAGEKCPANPRYGHRIPRDLFDAISADIATEDR